MKLSRNQEGLLTNYFKNKPVAAVYVFGSYARGDADDESDIDLLLEVEFAAKQPLNLTQYKKDLQILLSKRVDLVQHHIVLKYARKNIWKDRLRLHTK
jgi:predicted nucleotidyltransferase